MPVCECGHEQEGGKYCQECGVGFPVRHAEAEFVMGMYGNYTGGEMEEVYGEQATLSEKQWYDVAGWAENEGVEVRIRVGADGGVTVLGLVS